MKHRDCQTGTVTFAIHWQYFLPIAIKKAFLRQAFGPSGLKEKFLAFLDKTQYSLWLLSHKSRLRFLFSLCVLTGVECGKGQVKDLVLCTPVRRCLPEKYFYLTPVGVAKTLLGEHTPPVGILLRSLVTLRCLPSFRRCSHKTFNHCLRHSPGNTQSLTRSLR